MGTEGSTRPHDEEGDSMARSTRVVIGLVVVATTALIPTGSALAVPTTDGLYVPPPNEGALAQIADLEAAGDHEGARLISAMIGQPQAVWFTGGTPREVQAAVKATTKAAARDGVVPVLVAYNIPFRDCAQFSAGGATTVEEYAAWIAGFARGIGGRPAVVILEPDGLGIIPHYIDINGNPEWCQPPEADPETAASDRFSMLNAAIDRLNRQPGARVYLDGTHSAWLGVGDAADRLVKAGVERAAGFFVNVSNYRFTDHLVKYGTWISSCVALGQAGEDLANCASQYFPANPNDFSTWHLTDEWYAEQLALRGTEPITRFVIDTSRNGQGHWTPPAGVYPDPQDWCNPPGRGLGERPTLDPGIPLVDALLWVKIPGESDGECTRGLGPAGTTVDPEWGIVDPAAGDWFPQQARELADLASPPLAA
jgi:endoglucanase